MSQKTKVHQSGLTLLKDLDDVLQYIYVWRAGLDNGHWHEDQNFIGSKVSSGIG